MGIKNPTAPCICCYITLWNDKLQGSVATHLRCGEVAATLFCDLSLTASFADINVSQGNVATYARCGGIFSIRLTANLLVKFFKRLRFDRIMSLWSRFFGPPCPRRTEGPTAGLRLRHWDTLRHSETVDYAAHGALTASQCVTTAAVIRLRTCAPTGNRPIIDAQWSRLFRVGL